MHSVYNYAGFVDIAVAVMELERRKAPKEAEKRSVNGRSGATEEPEASAGPNIDSQ